MPRYRATRIIEGVKQWACLRCRCFFPRAGYYGKSTNPPGRCRKCDKARPRVRAIALTPQQLEEQDYMDLVERIHLRSNQLQMPVRSCMIEAMQIWLAAHVDSMFSSKTEVQA